MDRRSLMKNNSVTLSCRKLADSLDANDGGSSISSYSSSKASTGIPSINNDKRGGALTKSNSVAKIAESLDSANDATESETEDLNESSSTKPYSPRPGESTSPPFDSALTGGSSISSYSSRNSVRSIKQMRAMSNVALSCRKIAEKVDDSKNDEAALKSDGNKLNEKGDSKESEYRGLNHFLNEENNIDDTAAQDPVQDLTVEEVKSPEKRPSVSWDDSIGLNGLNYSHGESSGYVLLC